jgi:hypothetical protein
LFDLKARLGDACMQVLRSKKEAEGLKKEEAEKKKKEEALKKQRTAEVREWEIIHGKKCVRLKVASHAWAPLHTPVSSPTGCGWIQRVCTAHLLVRAVGELFVVPAWALPVPVSGRL